jgi:hypothetical protein
MTHDAMTEHYEEITVCGKPALFTSIRIKRDTVPEGLYAYDVRHDDECRGIPCEIAPFIMVNHWGTIILTEPLELPDDGRRYIDEDILTGGAGTQSKTGKSFGNPTGGLNGTANSVSSEDNSVSNLYNG